VQLGVLDAAVIGLQESCERCSLGAEEPVTQGEIAARYALIKGGVLSLWSVRQLKLAD
jgi:hypothetical protein